jgi:RND family efflux transporter MFP subunit
MNFIRRFVACVGIAAALSGCGGADVKVAELPPPPVTVSRPIVREVVDYDEYEGRIQAQERVEIRARVRGYLTKVDFKDGQLVKKGDLLFEIDPRPYQAALEAAEAERGVKDAAHKLTKVELGRAVQLVAKKAMSQSELDTWTAKENAAIAEIKKADANIEQAKLDLNFTRITAPISGRCSRRMVDVGNLVQAGAGDEPLTTLVSVDPLYVTVDVDERALLNYRRNSVRDKKLTDDASIVDAKIPLYVGVEGEKGFPHKGYIDFVDNKVNPSTGTIVVRGVIRNESNFLADGMRAKVRVASEDPHQALLVTERAIGNDKGLKYVYVVNADNVVLRRDVELDRVVDGLQAVRSGLQPDDWVVVNGIQRVRDGLKVQPTQVPMPGSDGPEQKADAKPSEPKEAAPAPKAESKKG